jgi:hypothetical protein
MNQENKKIIECSNKNCSKVFPPTAKNCPQCGKKLPDNLGPTSLEEENSVIEYEGILPVVTKPDPDELPSYINKLDIFLVVFVVVIGVFLNFFVFNPNKDKILNEWIYDASKSFYDEEENWKISLPWPPKENINIVYVPRSKKYINIYNNIIEKSGIKQKSVIRLSYEEFYKGEFQKIQQNINNKNLLLIVAYKKFYQVSFTLKYWNFLYTGNFKEKRDISILYSVDTMPVPPVFVWKKHQGFFSLYFIPILILLAIIFLSLATHFIVVKTYRNRRIREYEKYQSKRTNQIFKAKSYFDEAKKFLEDEQIAKAFVSVNNALKIIPKYADALELKRLLFRVQAGECNTSTKIQGSSSYDSQISIDNIPTLLYLRVLGTPYAYQIPLDVETISIGRQRKKPGISNIGSDIVIRVPGSEEKSLRISRTHLKVEHVNNEYYVTDKSNGNTKLNGKVLIAEKTKLHSGDQLILGGVVTLEVVIRSNIHAKKVSETIISNNSDGLFIEATIGDMLTEEYDENVSI